MAGQDRDESSSAGGQKTLSAAVFGPPPHESEAGQEAKPLLAGRYLLEKAIGRGGMGMVYAARQLPIERLVAVKILHPDSSEQSLARFEREARLIAGLQSPHVVNLIDFGEDQGHYYLVMEYITGRTLSQVLKDEGPLSIERSIRVGLQVAEALSEAHQKNVIHRDLKPDNLMFLDGAHGGDYVKLLDFGVAKVLHEDEAANTIATQAGLVVGSLRYLAPEQAESRPVSPRTDVYAVGCLLYEMVSGRRVFEYKSPAKTAVAHLREQPQPPRLPDQSLLRGPLLELIMVCLEKKPERRPKDGGALLEPLKDALSYYLGHAAEGASETSMAAKPLPPPSGMEATRRIKAVGEEKEAPSQPPLLEDQDKTLISDGLPWGLGAQEMLLRHAKEKEEPLSHASLGDMTITQNRLSAMLEKGFWGRFGPWLVLFLLLLGSLFLWLFFLKDPPRVGGEGLGQDLASHREAPSRESSTPSASSLEKDEALAPAPLQAEAPPPKSRIQGTRLLSKPEGASLIVDGAVICETPCTLPWDKEESPPRVTIQAKGHVAITLKLADRDHGEEMTIGLSPVKAKD